MGKRVYMQMHRQLGEFQKLKVICYGLLHKMLEKGTGK